MILKKLSAALGLLSVLALLIHVGYHIFSYLTLYYNPMLTQITALPFIVLVCCHAILGMCSVFLLGDGTRTDRYRKRNRATIIQRISAALIFPLLILHLNMFGLLSGSAENGNWVFFCLLMLIQILFYLTVMVHAAISFPKGFITLGLIEDRNKLRLLERITWAVCAVVFLAGTFSVVRGQLSMFLPK